jgi:signal peptidase
MILFFLFELYKFIVTLMEVRKPELTEADEEEIKKRAIEEYLAEQKKTQASAGEEDTKAEETPAEDKK